MCFALTKCFQEAEAVVTVANRIVCRSSDPARATGAQLHRRQIVVGITGLGLIR
jgi:hypothetical protein